jgi:hypothetical protein
MFKQFFGYLKAWIRGEEAELHIDKTWHFAWWELIPILGIIGLIIYWVIS